MVDLDPPFNYDLERIQRSIDSGTIRLPSGLDRDQRRAWLKERCIMREFVESQPEDKKNDPIMISCPCSRCNSSMQEL